MSKLLEEAIVDAKALKDAALKNAESVIIEKYSNEVRQTLEQLLEQDDELGLEDDEDLVDDLEMDMAPEPAPAGVEVAMDVPLGAAEGEELCACPDEGAVKPVVIDFEELQNVISQMTGEEGAALPGEELEDEEEVVVPLQEEVESALEEDEEVVEEAAKDPGSFAGQEAEAGSALAGTAAAEEADVDAMNAANLEEEDFDIPDELLKAVMEELTVDLSAQKSGWAGTRPEALVGEMEREAAQRSGTGWEEKLKDLEAAQEKLQEQNSRLSERASQYQEVILALKEKLDEVNISNARLLYTNRVLRNVSLNERQKKTIAEAISKAGSVNEAKTIFETLQSAVGTDRPTSRPQSLSEAISRPTSIIRASRKKDTETDDPISERMKRLAGINN